MSKGLSSVKTLTAKEIAKKWNLPLVVVSKKIAAGVKVEKEHTKSTKQANEIARDHLGERPDYYEKLDKIEKTKVVKEQTGVQGVRGLGYVSGDPSGTDYVEKYINTNSMSYQDDNGNKFNRMKTIHNKLHNRLGFKEFDIKNIKSISNKDLAESLGSDYGTAAVPVVGDLTGSSRKVMKVDEIRLPKVPEKVKTNIKGAIALGMTAANIATGADIYDRASRGVGSPIRDVAAAASGLPGKVGYGAMGANWTVKGFDKAREHIKARYKQTKEEKSVVPANSTERGIYEISAELVGKVSNARFWRKEAPSKTLTRAINKKFIESGKPIPKKGKKEDAKESWTPFFPPHHKHSARLSKEKSNKPDIIMDPGAGGTTKTIHEVKQMDTKNLINEALDDILDNNLVSMKENLMTALQEKAMEKLEERKKIIASEYFAQ